jgi:flagellar basal body rod protein FlgC
MLLTSMLLFFSLNSAHAYERNDLVGDGVEDGLEESYENDSPTFVPSAGGVLQGTSVNQAISQAGQEGQASSKLEFVPNSPDADENGYVSHDDPIESAIENEGLE